MPRPVPSVRPPVRIAVTTILSAGLLALAGCGAGEPRSIDPAGVDGLEIPTATPDPADFVRRIDNTWFPLPEGAAWTYDASSGERIVVEVTGRVQEIAGVRTTEVATTTERRRRDVVTTAYFAQDRDGNVWSFGEEGRGAEWRAGVDGAQAGLVMPARPRVGDGFVEEYAAGVAEDRSEVLDLAASVSSPYDSWTDAVEVRGTSGLDPELDDVSYYAPGVGLVRSVKDTGSIELVSFTGGTG